MDLYYYTTAVSIISKFQAQGPEKIKHFCVMGFRENNAILTTEVHFPPQGSHDIFSAKP